MHTLIVLILLESYAVKNEWNYRVLCLVGSNSLMNVLINIYCLFTTVKPSGQFQKDRVNHIARIEAFIITIIGLFVLTFPNLALVLNYFLV
jgi:hypothetical protein